MKTNQIKNALKLAKTVEGIESTLNNARMNKSASEVLYGYQKEVFVAPYVVSNALHVSQITFDKTRNQYKQVCGIFSVWIPGIGWESIGNFKCAYDLRLRTEELIVLLAAEGAQVFNLNVINHYGELRQADYKLHELTNLPVKHL